MKTEIKKEEAIKILLDPKNLPPPFKKRRFYTPNEVKTHCSANDCWVSIFNEVYNLTDLIQKNYGINTDPIVLAAGTDITHWFDNITKDVFNYYNLFSLKYLSYRILIF